MTSPRVNLSNPLQCAPIEAATIAAYALPIIRVPARSAQRLIFSKIEVGTRRGVNKLMRGAYRVVNAIVNNRLTRYISPSVTAMDDKIASASNGVGTFLKTILHIPNALAFYLIVSSYALAVTLVTTAIFAAVTAVGHTLSICVNTVYGIYKTLKGVKEDFSKEEKALSKGVTLIFKLPFRLCVSLIGNSLHLIFSTLYKALSSTICMPFLAPTYALSSVFNLDNRFNMYQQYESGTGVIGRFVEDMDSKVERGGCYLITSKHSTRLVTESSRELESTDLLPCMPVIPTSALTQVDAEPAASPNQKTLVS